jgi:hypothetical protein
MRLRGVGRLDIGFVWGRLDRRGMQPSYTDRARGGTFMAFRGCPDGRSGKAGTRFGTASASTRGRTQPGGGSMSSFATFLIGFVVLVIGLAIAASLLGVPTTWIAVGVIVLLGIGIISATNRTKPRDPPPPNTY